MKKIFPGRPRMLIYASGSWNLSEALVSLSPHCSSLAIFSDPLTAATFVHNQGETLDSAVLIMSTSKMIDTPFGLALLENTPYGKLYAALRKQKIFPLVVLAHQYWLVCDQLQNEAPPLTWNDQDRAIGATSGSPRFHLEFDWKAVFANAQGNVHEHEE